MALLVGCTIEITPPVPELPPKAVSEPQATEPPESIAVEPLSPGSIGTGLVINAAVLNVRSSPDVNSSRLGQLQNNAVVQVLDGTADQQWWHVCCLPDGVTSGWVSGQSLDVNLLCPDGITGHDWVRADFWRGADLVQVQLVLRCGTDIEAKEESGFTPLHLAAAWNENPAVVQMLLEAGADPNAKNEYGQTPLHQAARENQNPEVVQALLDAGADIEATTTDPGYVRGKGLASDWTPLHLAAAWNDNPVVVQTLLDAGADIEAKVSDVNAGGLTPLHLAMRRYDPLVTVIQMLLEAGADPDAKDDYGRTPLDLAAKRRHDIPAVIQALLDAGAESVPALQSWCTAGQTDLATISRGKVLASLCSEADTLVFVMGPLGGDPEFEYRGPVLAVFSCQSTLWSEGIDNSLAALAVSGCHRPWSEVGLDEVAKAAEAPESNGFYTALFRTGILDEFVYIFRHKGQEYQIVGSDVDSLRTIPPFDDANGE